jgi:hypothetical protein
LFTSVHNCFPLENEGLLEKINGSNERCDDLKSDPYYNFSFL